MRLRIYCPRCDLLNRIDEEKRGVRVFCRVCGGPIDVPDEDDEDQLNDEEEEAPPPRKKKKKSGSPVWIIACIVLGVTVVVLVTCLGLGSLGAIMLFRAGDRVARARQRNAVFDQPNVPVANARIILDLNDALRETDPLDPTPELREVGARMKAHQVNLIAGKTYTISLDSQEFDAYLRLESADGITLAEDDDGGGDLNARIVFRATKTGMHRVIATAWDGGLGAYRLEVRESD